MINFKTSNFIFASKKSFIAGCIFFTVWLSSLTSHCQVVLNEICAANGDLIYDTDFFNFPSWIELHNTSSSPFNVGGYYLSDTNAEPFKWVIPFGTTIAANGFLLIWCDGRNTKLHTNFLLDAEGEEVILTKSNGVVIERLSYKQQYANVSYGRTTNGTGPWEYLVTPSPQSSNFNKTGVEVLSPPLFSKSSGRYGASQQLELSSETTGSSIRFTTDGSEPTTTSSLYTTSLSLSSTIIIKAKVFKDGYLPSKTRSNTYFINEHSSSLPTISISTNPLYLYDNTLGIYVQGTNGVDGFCQGTPANWNQDWERHAVFEYFDKDGKELVEQAVDIRIGGNCSRTQPQKSLVVKARDKYGSNTINFRFFESKDVHNIGGLMLRNSGNDFNVSMIRDELMQKLTVGEMDIDYLDYQPSILYLNGQYMGIINIREKIDADYVESNYSLSKDKIDLLETFENALEGSADTYINYRQTLQGMDRSTPQAFDYIDQNIDVQSYIDYLVTQIYYGNTDWPGNNIKFWRPRANGGKFRWILWDLDFGFALYEPWASSATHPTLNFATATDGPGWPNPPWSTLHIRLVLQNPIFRARFIQTMNTAINTTFKPERVIEMINSMKGTIEDEVPYHKQRWWGTKEEWNWEIEKLRQFAISRNAYMKQHVIDFFGLTDNVTVSTNNLTGGGKIKLNGVILNQAENNSQIAKGLPFQIQALPNVGSRFREWKITKQEASAVPMILANDLWRYSDTGTLPATNWFSENFDDTLWKSGNSELGYGEGDEETVISFGPDPSNKFITSYFRKKFNLTTTSGLTNASVSLLVDDGAILYCNGQEVFRHNMPSGVVSATTLATINAIENQWVNFTIPANLLKVGENTVAVEVHQNSPSSSDISFALSISSTIVGNITTTSNTNVYVSELAASNIIIEAYFESGEDVIHDLVINEISTVSNPGILDNAGEAEDWIEVYNAGTQAISLSNLYVTDNLNLKTKYRLPVSEELHMNPGEYKVLWADEDLNQGPTHLPFKLSSKGEAVGIYQINSIDVNKLDEIVFQEQATIGSFSRIPNAIGDFTPTWQPTANSFNELTTSIEKNPQLIIYPNPVEDRLFLKSEQVVTIIALLDNQGISIQFPPMVTPNELDLSGLPTGLYILQLQAGNKVMTYKLVKR